MLRFIPTTNTAGPQLIAALWRLSRTEPGEQDTQGFGTLNTALDGSVWLAVDTTASVRVHATAELDGIADILQPWIDAGQLPTDTIAVLEAFVESKRGQRMIPWEAFPQLFRDISKTYAEMIAAGLLAEPAMP